MFWFRKNEGGPQPHFHQFSSWAIDAVYQRFLVDQDTTFILNLLDDFVERNFTGPPEFEVVPPDGKWVLV